jgi:di/tripeptidase
VDIRSTSAEEIERLASALRSLLERAAREERGLPARRASEYDSDVRVDINLIGDRPAAELAEGARILQVVRHVDAHLGIRSRLHRASTDANIPLALGREAVSLGSGGSGGNSHTLQEWYDPQGREIGLRRILLSMLTLAEMAREPKVEVKS